MVRHLRRRPARARDAVRDRGRGPLVGQVTVNNISWGSARSPRRLLGRPGGRGPRRHADRGGARGRPLLPLGRAAPHRGLHSPREHQLAGSWRNSASAKRAARRGISTSTVPGGTIWSSRSRPRSAPEGLLARSAESPRVTRVFLRHTYGHPPHTALAAPNLGRVDLSALIFVALAVAWAVYLIPKRSSTTTRWPAAVRSTASPTPCACWPAASRSTAATPAWSSRPDAPRLGRDRQTKASERLRTAPPLVTPAPAAAAAASATASSQRARPGPARQHRRHRPCRRPGLHLAVSRRPRRPARRLAGRLPGDGQGRAAAARPAAVAPGRRSPRDHPLPEVGPARSRLEPPRRSRSPLVEDVPVPLPGRRRRSCGRRAWDMVPTTLPTYVSKAPAVRRTVQTIDLDSTGVWSSGRNDDDSALAREAEESERSARAAETNAAPPVPDAIGRPRFPGAIFSNRSGVWRSW